MGKRLTYVAVPHVTEALISLGRKIGAVIRTDIGDERIIAALLTRHEGSVLTLNVAVVGTDDQERVIAWAMSLIVEDSAGFYVLRNT